MSALHSSVLVMLACLVCEGSTKCVHPKFSTVQGHTGCITVDTSRIVENGVSDVQKREIVDKHNELRGGLRASNMQKMVWDEEVASIAQIWADNCDFDHDTHHRDIPGRFPVGQNLALGSSSWMGVVHSWYNEIRDYSSSGSNDANKVGHFTQVAWHNSAKIGCGYAQCSNLQVSASNGKFFVCNYAPAGNVGGSNNPYNNTTGVCGACPSNCNNSLCDCGGKVCENGGTLDLNTCICSCKTNYMPGICSLNCSIAVDLHTCGESWPESYCQKYSNIPADCPNMCGACPFGGVGYTGDGNSAPEISRSLSMGLLSISLVIHQLLLSL